MEMIREKELELLETLKLANTMNLKRLRNLQANQIYGEIEGKEIKIKGASNGNCELEGIAGDMKQDVRQGYNKLIYPFIDSTKTNNGVTFSDLGNGIIVANGTASADAYFNLSRPTLQSGTYLYTIDVIGSTTTFYAKFGTQIITNKATLNISEEFTPTESYLCVKKGTSVNNLIFKPMLIEGTIEKSFEQYGVMPSLDFPSDVEGVETYNILPLKDMEETDYDGLKISIKDNTITINGTSTKSIIIKNILKEDIVLNKGEYYLQYVTENTANINSGGLYFSDTGNSNIIISNFWNSNNKLLSVNNIQTISSSNSNLFSNVNQTYNNTKQKIMLVKKKKRDIFIPYGVIQTKIKNKNHFDIGSNNNEWSSFSDNGSKLTNLCGIPSTVDMTILNDKVSIDRYDTKNYMWIGKRIFIEKNTDYIITRKHSLPMEIRGFYTLNINSAGTKITVSNQEFNSGDFPYYFVVFYPKESGEYIEDFQIIEKSTDSNYTKHQNQKYQLLLGDKVLYGNENARDYFEIIIDKALYNLTGYKKITELKLVKNWEKVILDGTNKRITEKSGTTINNMFKFLGKTSKILRPSTNDVMVLTYSNCFYGKYSANYLYTHNLAGIAIETTGAIIIAFSKDNDITTIDLANEKLQELNNSGNPLYIVYQLNVPEEELIVDSLLISQIEEMINNIEVYDEETNISSDCYLKLKYCKSLQKYIENKIKEVSLNE